jgi:integrase
LAAPITKKTLTDRFIRSRGAAPVGHRDDYLDSIVPGMALRVTDKAHKSFVLITRYPSNPANPTRRALGAYGEIKLDEARDKARGWLELIGRGVDPRIEEARRRALEQRRQAHTFAAVAAQYLERAVKGPAYVKLESLATNLRLSDASLSQRDAMVAVLADQKNRALVSKARTEGIARKVEAERVINGEFVKRWGGRPITDILPEEVATAIRAIVARGAPYSAHSAFAYIRRLFNWAIGTNEFGITTSPAERLRPTDLIGRRDARDRVLADGELRDVWHAADTMGYPYGPLLQLLILTGQREREVADMRWSEVDIAVRLWTIPAERMKGRRAHEVPLAARARKLLEALPRFGEGEYLFSTTSGKKPVNGFSKAKVRLNKLIADQRSKASVKASMPPWVFHDLRRTVRTHLSALPVQDLVRELVIAHARPGLHKVYDQHVYREEKRECLMLWEKRLAEILDTKANASEG